jgi:predicted transcriptional regulator
MKKILNEGLKEKKVTKVKLELDEADNYKDNSFKVKVLGLIEYFSPDDIARITGVPLNTIKIILKREGIDPKSLETKPPIIIWLPRVLYDKVDKISLTYKK